MLGRVEAPGAYIVVNTVMKCGAEYRWETVLELLSAVLMESTAETNRTCKSTRFKRPTYTCAFVVETQSP